MHNVADATGVRVMRVRCPTCIFEPGNRMRLQPGRVRDMVDDALSDPEAGTIVCHDTMDDCTQAICRGFFDRYRNDVQLVQIACRLGYIRLHDRET